MPEMTEILCTVSEVNRRAASIQALIDKTRTIMRICAGKNNRQWKTLFIRQHTAFSSAFLAGIGLRP